MDWAYDGLANYLFPVKILIIKLILIEKVILITLLDGKIHIEPEEWLVPIADKYPALEKEYKMFEPAKNTDFTHKNEILAPIRTAWLAIANEVRTRIIESGKDIFIPELSF